MSAVYIPENVVKASTLQVPTIRMILVGAPFSGKSFAAKTFPNPLFLDFDHKLGSLDVPSLPFWQREFVESLLKTYGLPASGEKRSPNTRDAFAKWWMLEAPKFSADQTLVLDSWSRLQDFFDIRTREEPVLDRDGKPVSWKFYEAKMAYALGICSRIANLKCNVVFLCHETPERNEEGAITGRLKPMMDGSFKDKIASYFSEIFRQTAMGNKYSWTCRPTKEFGGGSIHFPNVPEQIPADYNELLKYK